MAHRIRLRKPWTRHDLVRPVLLTGQSAGERDSAQPSEASRIVTQQVDVPDLPRADDEGTGSLTGDHGSRSAFQATYCRRFNRPSGIELGDRVQLEVGEVVGRLVDIRINSKTIASFAGSEPHAVERYDITAELADGNDLEIEIHATDGMPRLHGAVNLWILHQG